jgi:hypothetical protein
MQYATWREECQLFLRRMDEELPPDATIEQRKEALRKRAHEFHQGTSWGKQVWQQERRKYLAKHGDFPAPLGALKSPRLLAAMETGTHFPFRKEGNQ